MARAQTNKLPLWLLLYVPTAGAEGHDAEVRLACRASEVFASRGLVSPAEAHECHLWSSQRQKLRKRDGVHVSKGSDDFCFWTLEKCFLFDHPVCLKRGDFVGSQPQRVSKVSPSVWQLCRATRGIHVEDGQLVFECSLLQYFSNSKLEMRN